MSNRFRTINPYIEPFTTNRSRYPKKGNEELHKSITANALTVNAAK